MSLPKHNMKVPKADSVTLGKQSFRTLPFKRLYKAVKKNLNDDDRSAAEFIRMYRKSSYIYEESRLDSEPGGQLRDHFFIHDLMDGPNGATLGSSGIDDVLLYMMRRYKNRKTMAHEALVQKGSQWENIALRIFGCNSYTNRAIYDYLFSDLWPHSFELLSHRLLCVMNGVPDETRLRSLRPNSNAEKTLLPDVILSFNQLLSE